MDIIYEDDQLIIVNKSAGIAIQSSRSEELSLHEKLQKKKKQAIFLTHRLDQVASGICIFTKSKRSCDYINQQFAKNQIEKTYLAVVPVGVAKSEGTITLKLVHNQDKRKAYVNKKGKTATLHYKRIGLGDRYECLEIKIEGGRFHQIRCMLAHSDMPIKGDVKYGAKRKNKDRSIHLHANQMTFTHPKTKEIVHFSAPLPSENLWQYFAENKL